MHTFERKHLVIVPNCSWPGSECDLLVVTPSLRVIDVEIKISRSDLKADAAKEKWYHQWDWRVDGPYNTAARRRRDWPQNVWKHYYCMPDEIWKPELVEHVSPVSGLLVIDGDADQPFIRVERPAKPNRKADCISPADAVDIARLASLRMWDALKAARAANREDVGR